MSLRIKLKDVKTGMTAGSHYSTVREHGAMVLPMVARFSK